MYRVCECVFKGSNNEGRFAFPFVSQFPPKHPPSPSSLLAPGINQTSDILMNVSTTSQDLRTAGNTLTTTLDSISSRVETLQAACGGVVSQCSDIPDPSTFQAGANYSNVSLSLVVCMAEGNESPSLSLSLSLSLSHTHTQLPDVSQELNDVQESLDGINIQNSIEEVTILYHVHINSTLTVYT